MALSTAPLPAFHGFGRVVTGVDPNYLASSPPELLSEIQRLLYEHSLLLFPDAHMTPAGQLALTKSFDPASEVYGHGNNATGAQVKSILHPDLKTLVNAPQVQLIGNGTVEDPDILQGLPVGTRLKHPSHESFHKDVVPPEDKGVTRFYRWHIDAALYDLEPPRVTTLYGLTVPQGITQTLRYDDGTGDELLVPLGGTAFVAGDKMFAILPPALQSLAVRAKARYAPHPYVWMTPAHAVSTGLGIVSEGLERSRDELPPFREDKIKTYPLTWKNPVTGRLHFQVHPCGVESIIIDPLPDGVDATPSTLYPSGAHLTDLREVRELLYSMQRPAISPQHVYTHSWRPNDLVLFHNRGLLHSVTGAFQADEKRAFWQCNLASSDGGPIGPSVEDLVMYAK